MVMAKQNMSGPQAIWLWALIWKHTFQLLLYAWPCDGCEGWYRWIKRAQEYINMRPFFRKARYAGAVCRKKVQAVK